MMKWKRHKVAYNLTNTDLLSVYTNVKIKWKQVNLSFHIITVIVLPLYKHLCFSGLTFVYQVASL